MHVGWPAIYVKQNHQYIQNPCFSISVSMWLEQNQGCSFFSPQFFSIYSFIQYRSDAQSGLYSTHLLPCVAESHTSLVTRSNKYLFSPWQSHTVPAEGKQVIPFSFAHKKITIGTCDSIIKRVWNSWNVSTVGAIKMIREEDQWEKFKIIDRS